MYAVFRMRFRQNFSSRKACCDTTAQEERSPCPLGGIVRRQRPWASAQIRQNEVHTQAPFLSGRVVLDKSLCLPEAQVPPVKHWHHRLPCRCTAGLTPSSLDWTDKVTRQTLLSPPILWARLSTAETQTRLPWRRGIPLRQPSLCGAN